MTGSGLTIVGLVGKIGAGKSTVAAQFAAHGAEVIDADALAHEAFADASIRAQVREQFGDAIFEPDGSVDRSALAAQVFGETPRQAAALATLEAIVHPWVREAIASRLEVAAQQAAKLGPRVVVLDVPLLVQGGWHARCDALVGLLCDDAVRHRRLGERGLSAGQIAAREAAWEAGIAVETAPLGIDWTVDTSGDLAYTQSQVDRVWHRLLAHE
jgi:dephospho-CoA kinase